MKLRGIDPIKTSEKDMFRLYKEPIKEHDYIMMVDVGKGREQDYSTFSVIDVSVAPFEQVATYRNNRISPILFPDVIVKYAKAFNDAYVVVESNNEGSLVTKGIYYDLEYENMHVSSYTKVDDLGIEMNKKIKRLGCSAIKDIIEGNKIRLYDKMTIKECTTFVAKRMSYEASAGNHDDLMMNLVLFGYFTLTETFEHLTNINLKNMIFETRAKEILDDALSFGISYDNGIDYAEQQEELERGPSFSFEVIEDMY